MGNILGTTYRNRGCQVHTLNFIDGAVALFQTNNLKGKHRLLRGVKKNTCKCLSMAEYNDANIVCNHWAILLHIQWFVNLYMGKEKTMSNLSYKSVLLWWNTPYPIYCVATISHQCLLNALGHPSTFHGTICLLNWYKIVCKGDLLNGLVRIKIRTYFLRICNLGHMGTFIGEVITILTQNATVLMLMNTSGTPQL